MVVMNVIATFVRGRYGYLKLIKRFVLLWKDERILIWKRVKYGKKMNVCECVVVK